MKHQAGNFVMCKFNDIRSGASRDCSDLLTVGKWYKVISVFGGMIVVINDKDYEDEYSGIRFNIRTPPETELEWLDRVQENFKE